jgi:hypothetical protein
MMRSRKRRERKKRGVCVLRGWGWLWVVCNEGVRRDFTHISPSQEPFFGSPCFAVLFEQLWMKSV